MSCTATRPRAYRSHCHSASIVPIWYAHARLAVPAALPLGPERAQTPSLHCHSASIVPIWYAHARLAVPAALPLGPERTQTPSLHCHSALNATRGTFTGEWQCELHCHSAPRVLGHLAIISMSILRAGSRPRLYRSLGIKRQANRTVGALRPRSHASVGQAILFWEGRELEHRR